MTEDSVSIAGRVLPLAQAVRVWVAMVCGCTSWHRCAALVALCVTLAAPAAAQDAEPAPDDEVDAAPELDEPAPETTPADEGSAEGAPDEESAEGAPDEDAPTDPAEALSVPEPPAAEPTPAPADEFVDPEPGEAPPAAAPPARRYVTVQPPPTRAEREREVDAEGRSRSWRYPHAGTTRPLTLPQGVMRFQSRISVSMVPVAGGGNVRMAGYFDLSVGIFDDWEVGASPVGVVFVPLLTYVDPTIYTRVRLVSGEVQLALRAEVAIPADDQRSAWTGAGAELAWTPDEIFRLETGLEWGLHLLTPLQQTLYVPIRAMFQAGSSQLGIATGAVMYNDADAFDVPLTARWAIAWGGFQGPLAQLALEGGFAHLGDPVNAWFGRATMTLWAYP